MKRIIIATAIIAAASVTVFSGCSGGEVNKDKAQPETTQASIETKPIVSTTAEPTTAEPITTEPSTPEPMKKEPTTEAPAPTKFSRTEHLRSGYWCRYDGGTSMYAYTFEAELAGYGKYYGHYHYYDVKNNEVIERNEKNTHEHNTNSIINYEITDDAVLLTEEGGLVSEMKFTEDNDVLIRNNNGKEERYYYFRSVPDYEEIQAIAP